MKKRKLLFGLAVMAGAAFALSSCVANTNQASGSENSASSQVTPSASESGSGQETPSASSQSQGAQTPSETIETFGFGEGYTSWNDLLEEAGTKASDTNGNPILAKEVTMNGITFASNEKNKIKADGSSYNNQGATITVKLEGTENELHLVGTWGSDSDGYILIKNGSTQVYKSSANLKKNDEFTIDLTDLEAGSYVISVLKAADNKGCSSNFTKIYYKSTSVNESTQNVSVTFNTNGGNNIASQTIEKGAKLSNVPTPTKDGFEFDGWYTDSNLTTAFNIQNAINEDTTLYAKWNAIDPTSIVTIAIETGITGYTYANISAKKNSTINLPALSYTGYRLVGFYTDANRTTPFVASTPVTTDMTLYAKFVLQRTVTFYTKSDEVLTTKKVDDGTPLSDIPAAKFEFGFKFNHWSSTKGGQAFDFTSEDINQDIALYPVYEATDAQSISVMTYSGDQESVYAEFLPSQGVDDYNAYIKSSTDTVYKKLDKQLIRKYRTTGSNAYDYYRVDALGLKAGSYSLKIVPVVNGNDAEEGQAILNNLTVISYDRTGFGFTKNSYNSTGDASGAYNADGTLKSGAQVIYVTSTNAKTVTATVNGTQVQGIQAILDAKQKKNTSNDILDIRFVGKVSKEELDGVSSSGEGLQIKGNNKGAMMNITLEGVGNDATIYGFGFLVRNCTNVEIRNLGFMTKMDDDVSLDTNNLNIWVHDCDFFYGANGGGDHAKGDGALDIKGTEYATLAYNHFWDTGKTTLNSNGDEVDYVSYHHNWFDHSDSRHPRIRMSTAVHIYNNYYDGVSKYGVGAAKGGTSAFVEANYFRNCKYPMLSSMQGSDVYGGTTTYHSDYGTFSNEDGGIIKSYGNKFEGVYTYIPYGSSTYVNNGVEKPFDLENTTSTVHFDAYEASSRDEKVPSTVKSVKGGTSYSNFDTDSAIMYTYTVQTPDEAVDTIKAYCGRVQGGDLKWEFNNATEDTNYEVISGLRSAIDNYSSKLVEVLGISGSSSGSSGTDTPQPVETSAEDVIALINALPEPANVVESDRANIVAAKTAYDALSASDQALVTNKSKLDQCIANLPVQAVSGMVYFTDNKLNNTSGLDITTTAKSYKNDKGSFVYDGKTYSIGAKFDSDPTMTIKTTSACKIKVWLCSAKAGGKFLVGSKEVSLTTTPAMYEFDLEGNTTYTLKRSDKECYMFLIVFE